jgi:hypothetical protein
MSSALKKSSLVKIVLFVSVISIAAVSSYAKGEPKKTEVTKKVEAAKIDPELRDKIAAFLVQRGHENMNLTDIKPTPIKNGYFFKVEGIDKDTNKKYYMEIISTDNYANWALLAMNEEGVTPKGK